MPKRRRHQPGKYKPKPEIDPNFTGTKPLTLFQADNGLWGAKDGDGNIEIEPVYRRADQTESLYLPAAMRTLSAMRERNSGGAMTSA